MAQRRSILSDSVRILLPIAILATGVFGFVMLWGREKTPDPRNEEEENLPLVETVPVAIHEGGLDIEVDGVVVPFREINLSAEVDGRIQHKADVCRAGQYVEKGTLLLKTDPQDYELEARRLWVGFDSIDDVRERLSAPTPNPESLIGLAQRDLELQQKELERLKGLHGGRIVSEVEIEQGERSVIAAENALQTLRSQLEQAKLSLERTEVNSPIDGVVVTDSVEQGDFVRRGTPLLTIEDTSKVEVKCSLQMDELYWLWNQAPSAGANVVQSTPRSDYQIPRAPATVIYRLAGREHEWEGVLSRYDGIGLDERTRTVPCRVVVDTPREEEGRAVVTDASADSLAGPPALVRGMYVTVRIHADPRAALAEIPEAAVRPGNRAWLVRGGKLEGVDVNLVRVANAVAIIRLRGLNVGDKVVVSPLAAAHDGMVVREQSDQ